MKKVKSKTKNDMNKGDDTMAKARIIKKDGTRRNRRLEKMCCMTQEELSVYVEREMVSHNRNVFSGKGWIYSPGTIPILLCAHLDTVHKETPKSIVYEQGRMSSPEGIGGDDRCGVYMILNIIKNYNCHVCFFEDEEYGGQLSLEL